MLSARENETLTQTGPGTPMGEVFRQYWMPVCLSREIEEVDGPPKRVKLLGEDFIVFRDSAGHPAVVEPHCPHRGANLFFGRNEECGIRCAYHGWKFDRFGNCVDIPNVTADVAERLKPRAKIRSLHAAEAGDIVWANFSNEEPPPLPQFEFAQVPSAQRYVSKKLQQCNWAQAVEGGLDTAHFSYLHAGISEGQKVGLHRAGPGSKPWTQENESERFAIFRWLIEDGAPRFTILEHKAGMLLCAARTADNNRLYWRMTQFLLPNHSLTPGNSPRDTALANSWVPIDDESCWIFCYAWHPDREIDEQERARLENGSGIFAEMDQMFVPVRRRENDYMIDRQRQKTHSFTGVDGISEQDQMIADSQGLIADRTSELLCQTDVGVVRFRQAMFDAVDAVKEGRRPLGVDTPEAYAVRSGDLVSAESQDIRQVVRERFGDRWGVAID